MIAADPMDEPLIDREAVVAQLERVLSSSVFKRAERSSALLRFIVEQTLDGHAERLKEYTLGAEALARGESFDPRTDPVVRAEASRLRTRLEQYYETIGGTDPVLVTLPKGSYVPLFAPRPSPVAEEAVSATSPAPPPNVSRSGWIPWSLAIVAIALAAAAWMRGGRPADSPAPFAQFEVELKANGVLASDVGTAVVVSPDGTRIVFVSRTGDGRTHLSTRRLDQPTTIELPGTDGARGPFLSPDGRWVGFWADGKLKKISADGGSPVILCDASDLLGASWGDGDTIIAAFGAPGKLWRVPAAGGGMPQVAIDLSAESTLARWPQILPGGQFVIYTASTGAGADRATIEVQSIDGGGRKVLVSGGAFGRYLTSGHLTYVNQGTVYAVPFDLATLTVQGASVPVLDDVSYSPLFGYAQLDVSNTGALVYRKDAQSGLSVVDWIDRTGERTTLLAKPGRYAWLRLSPDGRRLAVTATESGAGNILVYDTQQGDTTRITTRPGDYTGLTWSPDGGSLFFGGVGGMASIPSDRPGTPTRRMDVEINQTPWSVAPDGRRLAYYDRSPETGFDLWTVAVAAHQAGLQLEQREPYLRTAAFEVYPSFSPDGRWIAYASNESGAWEVYVRRFPDNGTKVRVSSSGGSVPRWSPNGRELVYRTEAHRIMVVAYTSAGDAFVPSMPRPWSQHALADTGVLPNFDIAPDGERVLALMPVARPEEQQTVNHVTFMLNVSEEIRRRLIAR